MRTTPNKNHSIYISHKEINGQPFLEVTLFNGAYPAPTFTKAVSQTTVGPTENQSLDNIIQQWMFREV